MFVYFWTVYSMGLRLNEGLNLQVADLQSKRGFVHVHRGKGAKDRYLPLPTTTLRLLRGYWSTHRHDSLLFLATKPGYSLEKHGPNNSQTPMSETAVQAAFDTNATVIDVSLMRRRKAFEKCQKKFVVDIQAVGHGDATLKYLAPYVHHVAIGDKRIAADDHQGS